MHQCSVMAAAGIFYGTQQTNIVQDIIAIIFEYHRLLYEILKFDENYKSSKVHLSENDMSATTAGIGYYPYILAGDDALKQGIAVWRIKVTNLH